MLLSNCFLFHFQFRKSFPPNEKQLVYEYNKNVDIKLSPHDMLFSRQMTYKFSSNTKVSSQWHIQLVYKIFPPNFTLTAVRFCSRTIPCFEIVLQFNCYLAHDLFPVIFFLCLFTNRRKYYIHSSIQSEVTLVKS